MLIITNTKQISNRCAYYHKHKTNKQQRSLLPQTKNKITKRRQIGDRLKPQPCVKEVEAQKQKKGTEELLLPQPLRLPQS